MIYIRLWGGLGNQLFQYSFGYAMAQHYKTNLILDTRFYSDEYLKRNKRFTQQQITLLDLPVKYKEVVIDDSYLQKVYMLQGKTLNRIIRVPHQFSIRLNSDLRYFKESRLIFYPDVYKLKEANIYYDGYWQSEKYFLDYRDDLMAQFKRNDSIVNEYCDSHNLHNSSVAIHIRLGDYGTNKKLIPNYNFILKPEYYLRAVEIIKNRVEKPYFYVFSNDLDGAERIFGSSDNFVYVNRDRHMTDLQEFEVMSRCRHHIISNSTYSWWAAWLTEAENHITIAPDITFGNENIIPDRWIKVQAE
ncbi:MAG: alpha-1,2-fucosyltransferase [Eubacterium sp.]|nr:alpha-1,2-fucosyltransferase [Eubacterium sp.]MCC8173254.1 alpha-1,2-fucosyltransferase [Odoribacter sp.]